MNGEGVLRIPAGLLAQARQAARAAYPEECCGLLIGRCTGPDRIVHRLAPGANVAPAPRRARFEIDPAVLLREQRAARAGGEAVIGLYHSHPDGASTPSAEDTRRAWQADQVWLILAVTGEGGVEAGAWLRGDGDVACFTPLALRQGEAIPTPVQP